MTSRVDTIGILGAGKVGVVLAQLLLKAGYTVYIAGSGDPSKIDLTVRILAPGAIPMTKEAVSAKADVIILALPLGKYRSIPQKELEGKIVIDAMNYWWEVDGERPEFTQESISTSELVQQHLGQSRIVKAFSHIGYHELLDEHRPEGAPDRKAIAIAGDSDKDVAVVSEIVNAIGFDPVVIGKLASGIVLQPHGIVFGAHVDAQKLRELTGV